MTMIASYSDLQAAITEWLARDQDTTLIARIPSFVQLFECRMNRGLFFRQMETRSTTLTDPNASEPEFITLPSDFQSMRRIRLTSVTGKPLLEFKSTVQMDEYRAQTADVNGQPAFFSIFGSEIELAPTPDAAYTIEMIYRQYLPPLASNATNWLLTLAPDLYLYGSLMESAPYIKEDARLSTWGTLHQTALDALNSLQMTAAFNAGPLRIQTSGRTP